MRLIIAVVTVALVSATIGFVAGAQDAPEKPSIETLKTNEVARVHSEIISAEDLLSRLSAIEKFRRPDQRYLGMALDSLVLERMLELESERVETRIKQHEIKAEAEVQSQIERGFFDQLNKEIVREQKAWILRRKNSTAPLRNARPQSSRSALSSDTGRFQTCTPRLKA
ncbi:MAG: hypothetical protein ACYTDT_01590 [Planctomycetota bacterium]|jgi:hypothetical protein